MRECNKRKMSFDESTLVCVCVCVCVCYESLPLCIHWCLEPETSSRHVSLGVMERWFNFDHVISRTIWVVTGGNGLLCHLSPNSRNQWQSRDVIPISYITSRKWFLLDRNWSVFTDKEIDTLSISTVKNKKLSNISVFMLISWIKIFIWVN